MSNLTPSTLYDATPERFLKVVESSASYDTKHFTRIEDDVVEEVLATCGLAAGGLYMYLERRANTEGKYWESQAKIAEACSTTERYVRELVNEKLVPGGFVVVTEKFNRFGRTVGLEYYLPYHKKARDNGAEQPPVLLPEPVAEQPPEQRAEPEWQISSAIVDTEVDTSSHQVDISIPGGLQRVWEAYPDHRKPDSALPLVGIWNRLRPRGDDVGTMLRSIEAWSKSAKWQDDGGQYVPGIKRFLNEGTWKAAPVDPYAGMNPVQRMFAEQGI